MSVYLYSWYSYERVWLKFVFIPDSQTLRTCCKYWTGSLDSRTMRKVFRWFWRYSSPIINGSYTIWLIFIQETWNREIPKSPNMRNATYYVLVNFSTQLMKAVQLLAILIYSVQIAYMTWLKMVLYPWHMTQVSSILDSRILRCLIPSQARTVYSSYPLY